MYMYVGIPTLHVVLARVHVYLLVVHVLLSRKHDDAEIDLSSDGRSKHSLQRSR